MLNLDPESKTISIIHLASPHTFQKKKVELDRLKEDLETLREKCEVFLRQAAASPSVPTLSSELNILTQSTNQVYSMCCIYLEK